jgi:hypothetical protein
MSYLSTEGIPGGELAILASENVKEKLFLLLQSYIYVLIIDNGY